MEHEKPQQANNILTVPMSIIFAGIIISGAIFLTKSGPSTEVFKQQPAAVASEIIREISPRPIDTADHMLGNPNADIVLLEYSDLECPFCKSFHSTMKQLMDKYAKNGKIAWAYRHFPLDIHPKSPHESEAAECAAELGGNDKFWSYVDKTFEVSPTNNGLDPLKLPEIAEQIGLDKNDFKNCLDSGKYVAKVRADFDDGVKAGVNGTPNTVLVLSKPLTANTEKELKAMNQTILSQMGPNGQNIIWIDPSKRKVDIGGAFQYQMMAKIIDLILSGK
ncbi:MAG: hypothetical protein EXS46_00335 [Candidatus Taylorbacteria bacterium]|nr:hypothetical protein [Candidatus Taylorbacteria bacterium]